MHFASWQYQCAHFTSKSNKNLSLNQSSNYNINPVNVHYWLKFKVCYIDDCLFQIKLSLILNSKDKFQWSWQSVPQSASLAQVSIIIICTYPTTSQTIMQATDTREMVGVDFSTIMKASQSHKHRQLGAFSDTKLKHEGTQTMKLLSQRKMATFLVLKFN